MSQSIIADLPAISILNLKNYAVVGILLLMLESVYLYKLMVILPFWKDQWENSCGAGLGVKVISSI